MPSQEKINTPSADPGKLDTPGAQPGKNNTPSADPGKFDTPGAQPGQNNTPSADRDFRVAATRHENREKDPDCAAKRKASNL